MEQYVVELDEKNKFINKLEQNYNLAMNENNTLSEQLQKLRSQ